MSIGPIIIVFVIVFFLLLAYILASVVVDALKHHPKGEVAASKYIEEFNKSMF